MQPMLQISKSYSKLEVAILSVYSQYLLLFQAELKSIDYSVYYNSNSINLIMAITFIIFLDSTKLKIIQKKATVSFKQRVKGKTQQIKQKNTRGSVVFTSFYPWYPQDHWDLYCFIQCLRSVSMQSSRAKYSRILYERHVFQALFVLYVFNITVLYILECSNSSKYFIFQAFSKL